MTDSDDESYTGRRKDMVARQIVARGITDPRVLAAMEKVPRHLFVSEALWDQVYGDHPLPIGHGQTISQPYIVAEMTQALDVSPDDRVLEIGTGSGYQAAILAELAYRVYTVERVRELAIAARAFFDELRYHNIVTRCGDGSLGWPEEAPFDAIMVTAGAPYVSKKLLSQLKMGGRMVIPVGDKHSQTLVKLVRDEDGIHQTDMLGCRFVNLVGEEGWEA
ncbi:MAG: protein-L-isoaspartate(D-aspartate) O-methyltransferase [Proteobacteria bacterium]|nr:protein-L-isoaspartate(D-aspartate) O-methyltransferase [Pseudomonadota bacterium]